MGEKIGSPEITPGRSQNHTNSRTYIKCTQEKNLRGQNCERMAGLSSSRGVQLLLTRPQTSAAVVHLCKGVCPTTEVSCLSTSCVHQAKPGGVCGPLMEKQTWKVSWPLLQRSRNLLVKELPKGDFYGVKMMGQQRTGLKRLASSMWRMIHRQTPLSQNRTQQVGCVCQGNCSQQSPSTPTAPPTTQPIRNFSLIPGKGCGCKDPATTRRRTVEDLKNGKESFP
ncbi:hypothetical protein GE061_012308 [Apolygus lucorum]|uniref:Uncharacterized protein n=1 Tax=Apolygus lucorum TaxID=248454 RepID=A0A8S9XS54_APOLU|nr:hypothetical protein GE061_012308 [Apolygus lucorum]